MSTHQRIEVTEVDGVTVVRFVDRRILDATNIEELGAELIGLVEADNRKKLLLNFTDVEFLSSATLNQLIVLEKRVKDAKGSLKLSNLRPEIYEVFVITRLNQLFEIHEEQGDALGAF